MTLAKRVQQSPTNPKHWGGSLFLTVLLGMIGAGCGPGGEGISAGESFGEDGGDGNIIEGQCHGAEDFESGVPYLCSGGGNGRVQLDIVGSGTAELCVDQDGNFDEQCSDTPILFPSDDDDDTFDFSSLSVPDPGVCCADNATEVEIIPACELDCGYAAVKAAAASLQNAGGAFPDTAFEEDMNEAAQFLLNNVDALAGEVVGAMPGEYGLMLGEGSSSQNALGHVNSGTLWMSCALDDVQPYLDGDGSTCTESNNSEFGDGQAGDNADEIAGEAPGGSLSMSGPLGAAEIDVFGGSYDYRIAPRCRRSGCGFNLDQFDVLVEDMWLGNMEFTDIQVQLASTGNGVERDGEVEFAAGSLVASISATVSENGTTLNAGEPLVFRVPNSGTASAVVGPDGSFSFDGATFLLEPTAFGYTDAEFWDAVAEQEAAGKGFIYDQAGDPVVQTLVLTTLP